MIYFFIIFILTLFIYIHIQFHWKINNDIDIPHIKLPEKDKLESICDLKQPFISEYKNIQILNDIHESYKLNVNYNFEKKKISLKTLRNSMINETYYSCNNENFIKNINLIENTEINNYFKPHMSYGFFNDLILGNKEACTPLLYSLNYRNYIHVVEGELEIKLIPPKYTKLLMENADCISNVNLWNAKLLDKCLIDKIETISITLKKNMILYIPTYWWYSIKYTNFSIAILFSYRTYINTLANFPQLLLKFIQKQNITYKIESNS